MTKINLFDLGLSETNIHEADMISKDFHIARVSAQHKDLYKVITEEGEISAEISGKLHYHASFSLDYPAIGDWVLVDRNEDKSGNAIIHYILKRKSCFKRKAAGKTYESQIVAANIDIIFICMSLNNDFNMRRLERYLSIAWDSMATPVVVLTKSDLCSDLNSKLFEIEKAAIGVDVIATSSLKGDGFAHILKYLGRGQTVAFVGSSGVGKSTLINKLMGNDILATKEIRADDKGKHTTTSRELFVLASGGVVIDTPGMRELQIDGADFSKSFADIEELAEQCQFRDCKHETEPRCAVKKAVDDGTLSFNRLENYKKMQREIVFEERKCTMTPAQIEKQNIIDIMGTLKGYKQIQKQNRKNKGNK